MKTKTYLNGDEGEYTGETQVLAGGLFYNVLMLEGRRAGEIAVTQRAPNGVSPTDGQSAKAWAEMQSDFRKLKS